MSYLTFYHNYDSPWESSFSYLLFFFFNWQKWDPTLTNQEMVRL